MIQNVRKIDHIARIVVEVALLCRPTFAASGWNGLTVAGLVLPLTALAGWCPAYGILGVKTCPTSEKR